MVWNIADAIREDYSLQFSNNPNVSTFYSNVWAKITLPISFDQLKILIADTSAHETGHRLGLVYPVTQGVALR